MKTKVFLFCGAIAGPLFTIIWFVQGLSRADYDPMQHPISSLSMGEFGWIQIASFVLTGSLILAFWVELRPMLRQPSGSVWGPRLIGLLGIGLIGAGIFVTDPLNGYPPGTPLIPIERTTHRILHDIFVARLGFRLLPTYPDLAASFGLLQRITVTIGLAWLTLLAVYLLKVPSETPTTARK